MEDLLYEQQANLRSIHRFIENFKKIGKANLTEAIIRNRIDLLEKYWGHCRALHPKLERLATAEILETNEYFTKAHFNVAEDQYFAVSDYLSEYLALCINKNTQASTSATASNAAANEPACPVQLPRIEMPKFSGSYLEWESFSDLFESLVVKNNALTDVQRLHYLKASLTGEASSILKNVAITAANYASAWETLKNRYQNKRIIIAAHLHSFVSIPSIVSDSVADLKTLRDTTTEALTALRNMKRKVDDWDDLLVYLISQKLDTSTRREWETHLGARTDNPTFDELTTFLDTRIRVLESIPSVTKRSGPTASHSKNHSVKSHASTTSPVKCSLCSNSHALHNCPQFKAQTVSQRIALIRDRNYCLNCLYPGHRPRECRSKHSCSICRRRHHTLVHADPNTAPQTTAPPQMSAPMQVNASVATFAEAESSQTTTESQTVNVAAHQASGTLLQSTSILLATAWVLVRSAGGRVLRIRALLDQGSERTFVTESVAQSLRVPRQRVRASVTGVGGQTLGVVNSTVELSVEPCHGRGPTLKCVGLVMSKLTAYTPPRCQNSSLWSHLHNLELADPDPASAAPIDLLMGADLYGIILKNGLQRGPVGAPLAQETIFGWVISGPTGPATDIIPPEITVHHCTTLDDLHNGLRELFEIEELPRQGFLTEDEQKCERHFEATHSRGDNGQYTVRLPFKDGPPIKIGESISSAIAMFLKLEARLNRNPELSFEYHNFLRKYLELGHMEPVPMIDSTLNPDLVYIPHLPVVRESSSTTRVRVVFNASSATSDGTSLNDHLLIGPKLQNDLPSIILRWRMHRYAFTADVQQMYRQIRVDSRDTEYQCILWREHRSQPITAFRLLTVTYGTASAPYQALRVMKQLALDEGARFPLGVPVLNHDCYVDDVLFGANTVTEAVETRNQVVQLLASGGFHLRKFAASDPDLLDGIEEEDREASGEHPLEEHPRVKVLGLSWNPESDSFQFRADLEPPSKVTKRDILSLTSKLFDPLGWLAPVIISAKILLQELWILGADWDSEPPAELCQRWLEYCRQLPYVDEFSIPRWTGYHTEAGAYEIHGFADASQRAYAAVVYLRILEPELSAQVVLLRAKTKVSPIKEISIPRLELCAVTLLSKLLASVRETINLKHVPVYGWTDSTIVLAWLSKHPSHWKTFVANRVSEVLTTVPEASWRHVPTTSNPADCASRGISVQDLLDHPLWWNGPQWLREHSTTWPARPSPIAPDVDLEQRVTVSVHVANQDDNAWNLHHAISSWPRLLRVTAYCLRFIEALKNKANPHTSGALTAIEIAQARSFWIRFAQTEAFSKEMDAIRRHQPSPNKTLNKLNPFFDREDILRVGGRLTHSLLPYDEKHPIILPQHRISELICAQAHYRALHGGTQLTMRLIRQNYWILGVRHLVKKHIHRCVPCTRERAAVPAQLMADLPQSRATPSRPFSHCGVDYAGPILVRMSKGRGYKSNKGYIAVFICFATRAVHIELVSDYTSSTFIAALERFVARRGLPSHIYSDNGTTFHGAEKELRQAFQQITRNADLANYLASDGITWKFLPPVAPHFGGLWEAGVKSVKHHLKRIIGSHTLTFEELTTLLYQIESCLNSRPIAPMTNDPSDQAVLTPGHFLIGAPLRSVPQPSALDVAENRLSRYQLVRRMYEQFWRRWSLDYLHSLQQRNKWSAGRPNIVVGDLVLLRNDNLPPSKWQLARVIECHPGSDGYTRVVTVKTADSMFKRPITKLCTLPIRSANSHTNE